MRRAQREQWFIEYPIGIREITGLTLTSPVPLRSPVAQRIVESGVLSVRTGATSLLEIEFDSNRRKEHVDFRPHLPSVIVPEKLKSMALVADHARMTSYLEVIQVLVEDGKLCFHLHPVTRAALAENSAVCTPQAFSVRAVTRNRAAQFILPLSLLRTLGIKVTNTAPCFERRGGVGGSVPVFALSRRHPVRTRVARRWLPFLFVLYVANFVDRANLAYAGLGMSHDLGFGERVFGTAAGIFFVGYLSLQIPGALMAERWGARRLIGSIMVVWGGLTVLTGFVQAPSHLYAARFLLGAAEAAFFPAVLIYLSHWFVYEDRAKAIANFMAAIPVSFIVGAPVAGVLLGVHWFGIAGWRWLFFLEGVPAAVLGLSAIFYLSDEPSSTVWLSEDERSWLARTLAEEKRIKTANQSCSAWDVLRYRPAMLLGGVALFAFSAGYAFYFWLPTMLKRLSGLSDLRVSLLGAVPFVAGLVAMQLNGWLSDLRCEQRWHISVPLAVEALAFLCLFILPSNLWLMVTLFSVVGASTCAVLPCLWNFPTLLLSDEAAAAAIGLMNTFGSLGGVVGPYAIGYLYSRTHSFSSGLSCLMLSCLVAASLVLFCPVSRFEAARTSGMS